MQVQDYLKLAYRMAKDQAGYYDDEVISCAHDAVAKALRKFREGSSDGEKGAYLRSCVRDYVGRLLRAKRRRPITYSATLPQRGYMDDRSSEILEALPHRALAEATLSGYNEAELQRMFGLTVWQVKERKRQNRAAATIAA